MNFKRILAASTACVLAAGSFAACSPKDKKGPTDQAKEKVEEVKKTQKEIEAKFDAEGAKLEVLTNRTDRVKDGTFDLLVEPFEKAYNCTIEFTAYTNYDMDTLKRMKTDNYGDVLGISSMVKQDQLADYFVSLGTVDELSETYRWVTTKKGTDDQVYGLATGGTASGIMYNTKIWAEAGYEGENMPTTPEGFIQALKDIKAKFGDKVIPYYTNYADEAKNGWVLKQFDSLCNSVAGGADAENEMLANKEGIFDEGNGWYEVYKFMFDLHSVSEVLEEDHVNTDWEASKIWFGEGKIGTMVMGSWALKQFVDVAKEQGLDPSCVGYMPVPLPAADGKIYSEIAPDFAMGVSKKSENQELAIEFVNWFVSDSGYAQAEGFIPTKKGSDFPDTLASFTNAELFEKTPAPAELDGVWNKINEKSDLNLWSDATDDHVRRKIVEAAFAGKGEDEFKKIMDEANQKWIDATKAVLG